MAKEVKPLSWAELKKIAENRQAGGGTAFFALKNDGDKAFVRLMHENVDSIEGFFTHLVQETGKQYKTRVACLKHNGSNGSCPLCDSGDRPRVRIYLHMLEYELDENGNWKTDEAGNIVGTPKVFDRGDQFTSKIETIASRTPVLHSKVFEIIRTGARGSTSTDYNFWPTDYTAEELPYTDEDLKWESAYGTMLKVMTAEELEGLNNKPAVTKREISAGPSAPAAGPATPRSFGSAPAGFTAPPRRI